MGLSDGSGHFGEHGFIISGAGPDGHRRGVGQGRGQGQREARQGEQQGQDERQGHRQEGQGPRQVNGIAAGAEDITKQVVNMDNSDHDKEMETENFMKVAVKDFWAKASEGQAA